ncbi:hypothetical protein BMS3Abin05_02230 [bacterium BMS3Abin05]|nr:hypothetical protein BMS3Abin05_02230 [bacterium BMS3Abin05]
MAVRPDTPQEKPNASECTNFLLIIRTKLIHRFDDALLQAFLCVAGLPGSQANIHHIVGKYIFRANSLRNADLRRIDQEGLFGIHPKPLNVKFIDVIIIAVVLVRVNGVKLIDLHKNQTLHIGENGRVHTILCQIFLHLGKIPVFEIMNHPFDKMLRRLSGGQGNHTAGVVLYPLQKPQGRQFAQHREIAHFYDGYFFSGSVRQLPARAFPKNLLDAGLALFFYNFFVRHLLLFFPFLF